MRIVAVTMVLLALGVAAEAQIADFTPQTPLIGALLHNDAAEARRLLEQGADPNHGRFVGFPPVFLAVARQDVELVRLMSAKGADLTVRDRSGSTALMWAAFNEAGDAGMVEELLRRGADPGAVNNTGESALTWALRRGETPAVAALRRAGASDTLRETAAVQKALALLQRSGAQFRQVSGCQSCHHNALPQMAIGIARSRGLAIDEPAARQDVEATVAMLRSVTAEALANRDRIPDPPISVSYALLGLAAEGHPADEVTRAMAQVVAAWQGDDGGFHALPAMRPPIESSDITASALSLRALQLYGMDPGEPIARAAAWLRDTTPRTTEEQACSCWGWPGRRERSTISVGPRRLSSRSSERTEDGDSSPVSKATPMPLDRPWWRCTPPDIRRRAPSISAASRSCCARNSPTAPGWSARAPSPCNPPRTPAFPMAGTSGSPPPVPAGRPWPWRCRGQRSDG